METRLIVKVSRVKEMRLCKHRRHEKLSHKGDMNLRVRGSGRQSNNEVTKREVSGKERNEGIMKMKVNERKRSKGHVHGWG